MLFRSLEKNAQVTVNVIDMTGRKVLTTTQNLNEGKQNISIDMERLASGVYTCSLEVKTEKGVTFATQKVTKM